MNDTKSTAQLLTLRRTYGGKEAEPQEKKNDSFIKLQIRGNNFNIHCDRIFLCVITSSGGCCLRPIHELDHLMPKHLVQ